MDECRSCIPFYTRARDLEQMLRRLVAMVRSRVRRSTISGTEESRVSDCRQSGGTGLVAVPGLLYSGNR